MLVPKKVAFVISRKRPKIREKSVKIESEKPFASREEPRLFLSIIFLE